MYKAKGYSDASTFGDVVVFNVPRSASQGKLTAPQVISPTKN
jgi:hypothetical protein